MKTLWKIVFYWDHYKNKDLLSISPSNGFYRVIFIVFIHVCVVVVIKLKKNGSRFHFYNWHCKYESSDLCARNWTPVFWKNKKKVCLISDVFFPIPPIFLLLQDSPYLSWTADSEDKALISLGKEPSLVPHMLITVHYHL